MNERPNNWGDWEPCSACGTLVPPRSREGTSCLDKDWCAKASLVQRSGSRVLPELQMPRARKSVDLKVDAPKKSKKKK